MGRGEGNEIGSGPASWDSSASTSPRWVIRGRSTSPWLREVAGVLVSEMPEARLVELDGGHACILEHPEEFVAALASHVDGAVAS